MKYLEKAIRFSIKNWMLILPLFVLTALANLIGGIGRAAVSGALNLIGSLTDISGPGDILQLAPYIMSALAMTSGIWGFIFSFISCPATYGLVNKQLETGNATLNDIGAAVSNNIVKYVIYFIGTVVVNFVIGIACFVLLLILSLLVLILKGFGLFLLVLVGIALAIAYFVFTVLISMWFAGMVVDGLSVFDAFKKSFVVVTNSLWTVLGIHIVLLIASAIAGTILGIFSWIPVLGRVIGPIIYSAVPTAYNFLLIVFLLMFYREYTGRTNLE